MMPLKFGARFTLTAQLSLDQPHLKCSTATRSPESQNKSPRQSEQTGFSLSMHKVWGMQLKQMNYQDLKIRIFHLKKKKKENNNSLTVFWILLAKPKSGNHILPGIFVWSWVTAAFVGCGGVGWMLEYPIYIHFTPEHLTCGTLC